jgi:hypothetical protein
MDSQFFSEGNQRTLYGVLYQDAASRQGGSLEQKQANFLAKALAHHMQTVFDTHGPMPVQQLNRLCLQGATKDFQGYLRRDAAAPTLAASERIVSDPANQPRAEAASQRLAIQQGVAVPPRPTFESNLLMDTGSRFEQLQQDRMPPSAMRPPIPDFKITLANADDNESAISMFERAKKIREEEAARVAAQQAPQPLPPDQQIQSGPQIPVIQPTTVVGAAYQDANPLVRFMSPPSIAGDANANPTLAQPIASFIAPRGPLPQDFLIKQDDIINYKEIEYNLVLYSADRDWLANQRETRYNFTVNFDVGNTKQGFYPTPTATKKFKNISRIELVKAIVPTEGLENLLQYNSTINSTIVGAKINVLTFPYILMRIPELDVNNYGTDNFLDNAFGVLQYDANWYTDTTNLSDGYLAMIPKFMKCQKVYSPTPLGTLQKLSIQLQRPNGNLLSDIPDVVSINNIYASGSFPGSFVYAGNYRNVTLASGSLYYLIQTSTWFSQWMFQAGNRIQIKGLVASQIVNPPTQAAFDFVQYLQQDEGLLIVGIGKNSAVSSDLPNTAGYGNIIIVQAPLAPVTTATPDVLPFGGTSGTNSALATALQSTTFSGAALINLTHQTNIVLRIITRELDPAARVRPDNL